VANLGVFWGIDLDNRLSGTHLPGVLAPRVGLEPTTLRLTDAGRSGIGRRDVGLRRSLGGVRVQHGAARCGQDCGHLVVAGARRDGRGRSARDPAEACEPLCASAFDCVASRRSTVPPVHRWNEINQKL